MKQQTLFFGQLAIDNIPGWLKVYIKSNNLSICDFGCALGQATKLLTTAFPDNDVTGQDISESGIKEAKRIFPELKFTSENLLQTTEEKYDILFSSNILEQFYDPHDIVSKLANSTRKFLIFLLPFYDDLKIKEHFYSFTYQNIPRVIADKFSLLFYKEIDTSRIPNTHWNGRQILLVYAIDSVIDILETNADNLIPCNVSKKEYRLMLIDSILKAESERKISEFLSFPIKQQLEKTLAQEQAEHQATKRQFENALAQEHVKHQASKQQLEQVNVDLHYVLSSFSWKITKPMRLIKEIINKFFKPTKYFICSMYEIKNKYPMSYIFRSLSRRLRHDGLYGTFIFLKKKCTNLGSVSDFDSKRLSVDIPISVKTEDSIFKKINILYAAKFIRGVVVIDCAFGFDINRNQRPIALAKTYASKGYFVFFLRYQFGEGDVTADDNHLILDRIYQIPRLRIAYLIKQFSNYLNLENKRLIITIPDDLMIKNYLAFKKQGFHVHYDIMDDWEAFYNVNEVIWYKKSVEYFFINNADYVSAVSKALVDKFKTLRVVKLVPNGTFPVDKIALLPRKQSIISVGYFGHLTEKWFNWSYILKLAEDKKFQIHIIGEGLSNNRKDLIKNYDNIFYHGYVQHQDLVNYIEKFEIGLIPFIGGPLSDAIDPLKVYEYLQHHRPVASSGLDQITSYPYCRNASNFEEFKKNIIILHSQARCLQKDRISSWLEKHYWSNIADLILGEK